MPDEVRRVSRFHRRLLIATASMGAVLIAMGSVVCATQASGGCPDWPACHGGLVPPLRADSIIEYSHRVAALLTALLVIASAVVGWQQRESGAALRLLPTITIFLIGVVAVFGAFAVLTGLPPTLAAIDLGTALLVLTLVVSTATFAATPSTRARMPQTALSRFAVALAAALFILIVSGVFVAQGSVIRCIGGPMHIGTWASLTEPAWRYTPRQLLAGAVALLAAFFVTIAIRRADAVSRRWSIAFAVCLAVAIALGVTMIPAGPAAPLLIASGAATAAAWSALVVVAVRTSAA